MQTGFVARVHRRPGGSGASGVRVVLGAASAVTLLVGTSGTGLTAPRAAHTGSARSHPAGHGTDTVPGPESSGAPTPGHRTAARPDPDEPTQACLAGYHSHFLQNAVTTGSRVVDLTSDSGDFLVLRHYVRGHGRPDLWEVVDNVWVDLDVGTPSRARGGQDGLSAGAWGGPVGSSSIVYRFDNEGEADDFFGALRKQRVGSTAKLVVRTNLVFSGLSWLLGRIPWAGGRYEKWIGGAKPDRKRYAHSVEGGLIIGFHDDLPFFGGRMGLVGKGWDWTFVGRQWNEENGETTTWFRTSGRAMESIQSNLGSAWRYAPGGVRNWASTGSEKAIGAIERLLSRVVGTPVTLPEPVRSAIRVNPSAGLGVMGQGGTQYALTADRNGKPKSLVQTDNLSLSFHLRSAVEWGPVGMWADHSVVGVRWITNKSLDLASPADRRAAGALYGGGVRSPLAARSELNDYFDRGGGTMARITYDSQEPIRHFHVGLPLVAFDVEEDTEDAVAQRAEYFVPGRGWVSWKACLPCTDRTDLGPRCRRLVPRQW